MSRKLVVVTREKKNASQLQNQLRGKGFLSYSFPTIKTVELKLKLKELQAIKDVNSFDYLIFTSASCVFYFNKFVRSKVVLPKIVAVGPATAKICQSYGFKVYLMPNEFTASNIPRMLKNISGKKVLLPQSKIGNPELKKVLKEKGAEVIQIFPYTTKLIRNKDKKFNRMIENRKVDYLTFTSPSTVLGFIKRVPKKLLEKAFKIETVVIGPETSKTAKNIGFTKLKMAKPFTTEGMVATLQRLS